MSLPLLVIVQWLHVLMGITWFGGYIFLDLILWPTLLKLPATSAGATYALMGKFAGPIMATSGSLVVLLGIIRGTFLGPIRSFEFLFGSAYGMTWLIALVLTLLLTIWGASVHDRVIGPVWEGDRLRPGVARRVYTGAACELTCFALVLVCMVLMAVGL